MSNTQVLLLKKILLLDYFVRRKEVRQMYQTRQLYYNRLEDFFKSPEIQNVSNILPSSLRITFEQGS